MAERQIGADKIILDPGIGFAKNDEQNLRLLQNLNALTVNACPVLLSASRKTTIGNVLAEAAVKRCAGNKMEQDAGICKVKKDEVERTAVIPIPPEERLEGTLAVTAAAIYAGVNLVRVHDVKENLRLIRMLEAIRNI